MARGEFNTNKFERRRERLRHPTPAEAALKIELDRRGIRHGREWPLPGGFFADFWFKLPRVVIEVGGGVHNVPAVRDKDERRTRHLNQRNIVVKRFRNQQVLDDVCAVADEIELLLEDRGLQHRG